MKLECCREWYELSKEYKAQNFYGHYLTFIYSGGKCAVCENMVLGYANYDDTEAGLRRDPFEFVHRVGSKTRYRYEQAISSGEAILQDTPDPDAKSTKGEDCGVSEYTLRACSPNSGHYLLKIARGKVPASIGADLRMAKG